MARTWRKKSDAAAPTRARSSVGVSVNTSTKNPMMHLRQVEDAQAVADGGSTDLVAGVQCSLVLAWQIAQEGGPIVAFEVLGQRSSLLVNDPSAARWRCHAVPEIGQPFLEVQGGVHVAGVHSQLDHGEGHVGLDADDHGQRAS